MLRKKIILLFLCGVVCLSFGQQQSTKKTRILFLLDGSGSMLANWEGKLRIDIAREILGDIVDSLKQHKNVELGLRVYGHLKDKSLKDCHDTRLEVPFHATNHTTIKAKLKTINPKGTTPLAYSLEQSARDFINPDYYRNIIIIITDGIESCDGDPCKISYELQKRNIFLKPFVIGIGIDKRYDSQLSCIGKYYNATNHNSLQNILSNVLKQSLSSSSVKVDLLDTYGKATETNINMSFVNSVSKKVIYDFIHFQDASKKSDKLEIDPLITYDLIVHTTPKVVKENIYLKPDDNLIRVKTPQGQLKFIQKGFTKYPNLMAIIRQPGKNKTLDHVSVSEKENLLVGTYNIEVLTLPRITFKNVNIRQSEITSLTIPTPGALSIPDDIPGYGSIYVIKGNSEQWIYNFKNNSSHTNLTMQPGRYKVVFRANNARGSKYTYVKKFTIQSGSTTTMKLFK